MWINTAYKEHVDTISFIRGVWRYQRGNHNPYIEDELTTQWPKENVQKDKQRSTKHKYKIKQSIIENILENLIKTLKYLLISNNSIILLAKNDKLYCWLKPFQNWVRSSARYSYMCHCLFIDWRNWRYVFAMYVPQLWNNSGLAFMCRNQLILHVVGFVWYQKDCLQPCDTIILNECMKHFTYLKK
jgi:hypothetical protein